MSTQDDYSEVLLWLQCCHSIINTAWPKPGVAEMAGAHVFLGTKLFTSLENAVAEVSRQIHQKSYGPSAMVLCTAWQAFAELLKELKHLKNIDEYENVDTAFNLLYLASGVIYHNMRNISAIVPQQNDRFAKVEDLDELLALCHYTQIGGRSIDQKTVLENVTQTMRDFTALLSKPK